MRVEEEDPLLRAGGELDCRELPLEALGRGAGDDVGRRVLLEVLGRGAGAAVGRRVLLEVLGRGAGDDVGRRVLLEVLGRGAGEAVGCRELLEVLGRGAGTATGRRALLEVLGCDAGAERLEVAGVRGTTVERRAVPDAAGSEAGRRVVLLVELGGVVGVVVGRRAGAAGDSTAGFRVVVAGVPLVVGRRVGVPVVAGCAGCSRCPAVGGVTGCVGVRRPGSVTFGSVAGRAGVVTVRRPSVMPHPAGWTRRPSLGWVGVTRRAPLAAGVVVVVTRRPAVPSGVAVAPMVRRAEVAVTVDGATRRPADTAGVLVAAVRRGVAANICGTPRRSPLASTGRVPPADAAKRRRAVMPPSPKPERFRGLNVYRPITNRWLEYAYRVGWLT